MAVPGSSGVEEDTHQGPILVVAWLLSHTLRCEDAEGITNTWVIPVPDFETTRRLLYCYISGTAVRSTRRHQPQWRHPSSWSSYLARHPPLPSLAPFTQSQRMRQPR
mmetsp:Transcript_90196/g.156176  ORF Transcript_90196/g.156176 Transcript_90196/m.156176 type:complete len:107 (-) Transcript_90196:356-676(-)